MRVLCLGNFYPPHSEGGYELVWQGAVRRMRAAGHEVRVLTSDAVGPAPADAAEEDPGVFRELRLYWRDHAFLRPLSPRARLRRERHNAAAFDRHVREWRPEVVTLWNMGATSLGLIERARRAGLPMVALVSDDWLVYAPGADQWMRLGRRLGPLRAVVERRTELPMTIPEDAVRWLFVSDATRRAALAAGWRLQHTEIAHTGVDEAFLGGTPAGDWSWRLLCVGRIDPRKGIRTAVRAVARLGPEASLTVVGHGMASERRSLERLAAKVGAADRVDLLPGRPHHEMVEVYDDHDAVLFCVRWEEPWGLVPLEAMARGRPVIASGRGGSAEYLRDGENCLLAHPERPEEVAAAVRRLADDPALRARLVETGFATARRHTAEAFERQVLAAVEEAAR